MQRILVLLCLCGALCACAATPKQAPNIALPSAPPPGEPAGLSGMQAEALRVAYGPPAFVRKDGPLEMWRYDSAGCKAFFFLYPDSGRLAVRHVETVPRGQAMAADTHCLDQLRLHPVTPVS